MLTKVPLSPEQPSSSRRTRSRGKPPPDAPGDRVLVIACGALAREIGAVIEANRLDHIELTCLPADWHNRP
jgi:hypothetical protein